MATRFPGDVRLTLWIVAVGLFCLTIYGIGRLIWSVVEMVI